MDQKLSTQKIHLRDELKRYEKDVSNYIHVLEEFNAGLWFYDVENNITSVNELGAQNLGYQKDELISANLESLLNLVHPDDYDKVYSEIQKCLKQKQDQFKISIRMKHKLGYFVLVEIFSHVAKKDEAGKPLVLFATQLNVDQEKQNDSQRNHLNSNIIENAPFPIVVSDIETGSLAYANARAKAKYALGSNDGVGSASIDFYVHQEARDAFLKSLFFNGSVYDFETELYDFERKKYWALMSATIIEFDSKPSIVVAINDINDRKMAELELAEEKRRYQLLTESISDVIWVLDIELRKLVYISPSIENLTGFDVSTLMKKGFYLMPSDSHKLFNKKVEQAYVEFLKKPDKAIEFTIETQVNHKHHSVIWVEHSCKISFDKLYNRNRLITVTRNIEERKKTDNYIEYINTHDQLTGLLNKTAFRLFELDFDTNLQKDYSILFVDLDNFALVNDSIGHREGDSIIVSVADKIQKSMQDRGTVYRYEGDEFVIFIQNSNHAYLEELSSDLVRTITTETRVDENAYILTASIGVASYQLDFTMDRVLNNAASALHMAKKMKNSIQFYVDTMDEMKLREVIIEKDLSNALFYNQLKVYYQPIYDVKKGRITQFEALLRWIHPSLGLISPIEFISLAEKNNYIIPITEWVYQEVLTCIKKLESQGLDEITFSVNFSILAFTNRVDHLISFIKNAHEQSHIDPSKLFIEITESMVVQNSLDLSNAIEQLRDMGIRFELDDFGTGYSTFKKIKDLPLNIAKIDRSLIQNVDTDKKALKIVDTMISVLHSLELEVVLEGVETLSQFETLISLEPDYVQGYLFHKPMPKEELLNYLLKMNEFGQLPVVYRFNENNIAIHWRNEWNSGIEIIDHEHRKLYRTIQFIERFKDDITQQSVFTKTYFQTIIDDLKKHFETEERIQIEYNYPQADKHAEMHQELMEKMNELFKDASESPNLYQEFVRFLTESYIIDHFLFDDINFAHYLKNPSAPLKNVVFVDDYKDSVSINDASHYRRKLKENIELQNLLSEVSHSLMLITADNFDQKINDTLKRCALHVNADRAYIFEYDFEKNTTSNTYEWCQEGISAEIDNLQDVPLDFIPEWVSAHKANKAINIYDVRSLNKENNIRQILEPQGVWSILTVPMLSEDHPYGFIGFDSVMKHHLYNDFEQAILREISNVILVAIKNLSLQLDVLKEKELYSSTLATLKEGVIMINPQLEIEFCNDAAKEIFGQYYDVLKNIKVDECLKIYDYATHQQLIIEWGHIDTIGQINFNHSTYVIRPNQDICFIEGLIKRNVKNNQNYGYIINIRDVSELKETTQLTEAFFTLNSDLLCIADFDGIYQRVNRQFEVLLGYKTEELNGTNFFDILHPDDIELTKNVLHKLDRELEIEHFINRLRTRSGQYRNIEWSARKGYGNVLYATGRDVTNRLEIDAQNEYLSYHDVMTDFYNRRYIEEIFKRLENDETRLPVSIISLDVDHLKWINDTYGHSIGDEAIMEASKILKESCRPSDIMVRYGGDEFMLVLPNTKEEDAKLIIHRINQRKHKIAQDVDITLSAGYCTRNDVDTPFDFVIRHADLMMYEKKRAKRLKST